ncbi:DUF7167 family protein [Zavarzinella formosa]|uniref:DUF7167 family protein n=1 Tax=Zavarzinella formosa TaxID=360055 RepID=UPI0002E4AC22|nr:hypothetical protein [Zavarzinella formosa]
MKLKVWIATDKVGSKCERIVDVPDEELEDMNEESRQEYFEECAREEIWNMAEFGWSIVNETA